MSITVDVSRHFWDFVRNVNDATSDAHVIESEAFCIFRDLSHHPTSERSLTLHEGALVPIRSEWDDAMLEYGGSMRDGRWYVFSDVNALFRGSREVLRVAARCIVGDVPRTTCAARFDALDKCIKRMEGSIVMNELTESFDGIDIEALPQKKVVSFQT